ncbi:aspartyl-phosphate phosphatase Spo0E family protein (plasmid) [Paenibacillus sp. RS8]|uniref:aspartyl-phosphate phosphatase Spo0E family protein n=1 Tax=unclassified Paenibacillus TaxID=185978 RepID=UPI002472EBCB|nr:aspartyl-phosphate phosphatase Spo0E family protein [Paenibacillus sp. PastF-3]
MNESLNLKKAIEDQRTELNRVGLESGLTSNEVLKKSKDLDTLLNQYNKLNKLKRAAE